MAPVGRPPRISRQMIAEAAHELGLEQLTLKDVADRSIDLEMAYNPNDCVELRWGAPERSDEASTCKRRAPSLQRAKMTKARVWLHERSRPPRA